MRAKQFLLKQQQNPCQIIGASKMPLGHPVALAAVPSKGMVLSILIHCLLLIPLFVRVLCLVLVLLCSTYSLVL